MMKGKYLPTVRACACMGWWCGGGVTIKSSRKAAVNAETSQSKLAKSHGNNDTMEYI